MFDKKLTINETKQLLRQLEASPVDVSFDVKKQTLHFIDEAGCSNALRLPLVFPPLHHTLLGELRQQIDEFGQTAVFVLIQAGVAALGVCEDGELTQHKMIKKYMVRKSQGKAQIKYLKSKGKSRLGSRIRLKNSVLFFEEINAVLQEWEKGSQWETIMLSLPVNLKNLMFNSNVVPPFDKKDGRIKKIPMDIKTPSFKELRHISWVCCRSTLTSKTATRTVTGQCPEQ